MCPRQRKHFLVLLFWSLAVAPATAVYALAASRDDGAPTDCQTVALWLFDEQIGLYPSSLLTDAGPHDYSLVLGRGGRIVDGKFGHALQPAAPSKLEITNHWLEEQQTLFGLRPTPRSEGRTVDPMSWESAVFCALWTCGEKHLRHMEFANPTETGLNLGDFDWTVEFWFQRSGPTEQDSVVFEIGSGPRGENEVVTRLTLGGDAHQFTLTNQAASAVVQIPTAGEHLNDGAWHHVAFVYSAGDNRLQHWLDGQLQAAPAPVELASLPRGNEAYMSVGRDGVWQRPLAGKLDELRFSRGKRYTSNFNPPASFSVTYGRERAPLKLLAGPPLLFGTPLCADAAIDLGSRKYLFLDDSLIAEAEGVEWTVNPPQLKELILTEFGGHLSVIQDEQGTIRLYGSGPMDSLVVLTSTDGIHFEAPDLGGEAFHGQKNNVIRDAVGTGEVFIDPNAPPDERWKYVSGVRNRGMFVYSSPDGYRFQRHETAALPFGAGSQSNVFYDDQRQLYVGYHRSDYGASSTTGHESERRFVLTEVQDLLKSWPFEPVTHEKTVETARKMRIKSHLLDPWYLDNGPLAPGGFGIEFPVVFGPDERTDPSYTDIYVPKAGKYAFAPDTYLAFPHFYFHYWDVDAKGRRELGVEQRNRGSGTIEVQTMTSRDGLHWKRYPRPVYIPPGKHGEYGTFHMVGMVQGMVRRGDEIWQYFTSSPDYHSAWNQDSSGGRKGVYRTVQRLDGFVSADFDYQGGQLVTKPLRFTGNQLRLNVNTLATGYAQVAILDKAFKPIPGFTADDCVYLNGDFIDEAVEWLDKGTDLSQLAGREIRVLVRGRGCKLYAMQFTSADRLAAENRDPQ
ncbi:MAG: LamG-like jellyroll fold domain-containing protein [Pirellulales bacterium]